MLQQLKHKVVDYLPALKSKNYRLYFFGQGISLVGTWLQAIAEAWLIYPVLTNNQSLLGIVSAVNLAPHFLFVLVAGILIDRLNKRRSLIIQQICYAILALVLFFLVQFKLIQVWQVMFGAFLFGLIFAFEMPTRQTLMLKLVEKKDYPSAISLNAAIFNGARAIGPALAGIAIATIGIAPAYLLNSLSFLAVIIAVLMMKLPKEKKPAENLSLKQGFTESFAFFRQNKIVVLLLGILFFQTMFTWPLATLLPVFAKDVFGKGEIGFGLLQSAFGLGALGGALFFSKLFSKIGDKAKWLRYALYAQFFAVFAFGFSPWFGLGLVLQVFNGLLTQMVISISNTLIQFVTPDFLRGRMLSFYSFVLVGGMPFGALLGSLGVGLIGPRLTVSMYALFYLISISVLLNFRKAKFQEKIREMV